MKHYYIDKEVLAFEELFNNETSEGIAEEFTRIGEIPFDAERKVMSAIHDVEGLAVMITKGEVEAILERAAWVKKGEEVYPFTKEDKIEIEQQSELFMKQDLHVQAWAYKLNEVKISEYANGSKEEGLVFIGLTADKKVS